MSIRLGPLTIEHPFILAPMAGITNSPFRRLMRKYRSSVMVSELVSATGIEYVGAKTLALLKFHEDERPLGLQIFGEDQEHLVKAARYVEKLGADFVDLNLGCPVPKVVKKGAGAAACRDPIALGKTLQAMASAIKIPLTIKIRTGWDSESKNAHDVVKAAADAGVAWVAIHGRTRAQGYSGEADWDFIGNIKAKSTIPIIGNGDLNTPEIAYERWKKYGVDAVLIGRGALRNPFIFKQAEALYLGKTYEHPVVQDYIDMIRSLRGYLEESFPGRAATIHARKFLAWYSSGFPGCHAFRSDVFKIQEDAALWNLAEDFFTRSGSKRDTSYMSQPFLMGGHG